MKISNELLEKIKTLPTPRVIGISGFGGAGKSTFAEMLSKMLDAPVICVDQFGIDRTIEDYTHWEGLDLKRLEKEVLIPFSKGDNAVRYGHWDHSANAIVEMTEVPNNGTLIIEGVGLFRPEILKYFSYKIWIDAPQDVAKERGKKRDREVHKNPQDEKWNGPWKRNDMEYFETYRPKEISDFIVQNP
ncbi:hypothetical protein EXS57_00805 [Candidatus Kaiserbacteria bacterium]|nr:hypothetical protein [Candidatus Kaiserbacteria bacterium]